ncbi:MAG: DUF4124 domain-containing protein [Propionivibrio sp.]
MIRAIVLFVMAMAASQATAEVFMCKNASGGTEFSDTPCKAGSTSEVVPDRAPLTQQQQNEARQKTAQQKSKAAELEKQRAAGQDKQEERQAAPAPAPAPTDVVDDEGAVATCDDGRRLNSNCARTLNDVQRNQKIRQIRQK